MRLQSRRATMPEPRLRGFRAAWPAGLAWLRRLASYLPTRGRAALRSSLHITRRPGVACSTAALIFSRPLATDPALGRIGSGRMQEEAFACLESLGLKCYFAGQEDSWYGPEITGADIIVSLLPGLLKLPPFNRSIKVAYACNTHVDVRLARLRASSLKWGLPCEDWPRRTLLRDAPRRMLYRAGYRLADHLLVAENDAGVENFVANGVPRAKILRYRNAVDTEIWLPATQKRDRFTFVCWSSSHGLRKGLPSLLAAWRQWYRGQEAELWLVGMPTVVSRRLFGDSIQGQPEAGVKLHLESFPGQHRPVIDLIGSCHVAVYPTLEDAQPSALLEMASCGLPVITTIESGVDFPEAFCRYVIPDDSEDIARAFEFWYQRRREVEGLGLAARAYIQEHHTWECFRARFSQIVKTVMEAPQQAC